MYLYKQNEHLRKVLSVLRAVDNVRVVCVVDEGHLLSFEMLEEIRFLLNMKFDSVSPIALILAGQSELWKQRLSLKKCEATRQRIDIQCTMIYYNRPWLVSISAIILPTQVLKMRSLRKKLSQKSMNIARNYPDYRQGLYQCPDLWKSEQDETY